MSEIAPFKIRKYLCDDDKTLMTIASDYFGPARDYSVQLDLRTNSSKKILSWKIYDQLAEVTLTISHIEGSEHIDIHYDVNFFHDSAGSRTSLLVNQFPGLNEKLDSFISTVKKPWKDWTEDEILKRTQWIYYFYLSNGNISEAMHNAMVLGDPSDPYVKKYFVLWQQQKSQSQSQSQ